jgi:hypothetical protein
MNIKKKLTKDRLERREGVMTTATKSVENSPTC